MMTDCMECGGYGQSHSSGCGNYQEPSDWADIMCGQIDSKLDELRQTVTLALKDTTLVGRVAQLFGEIDGWLIHGGRLPVDWNHTADPAKVDS